MNDKATWKIERDERLKPPSIGTKEEDSWPECNYCGLKYNPVTTKNAE